MTIYYSLTESYCKMRHIYLLFMMLTLLTIIMVICLDIYIYSVCVCFVFVLVDQATSGTTYFPRLR